MKRIFYLLLLLPLLMVSCKDDDDMPNLDFTVDITGGKNINGVIYVVKGDTLKIEKVDVASKDGKGAAVGAVSYFWDYHFLFTNPIYPYRMSIPTDKMIATNHLLQFNCPVYVVDYPILTAYFDYKVKLVESPDSIPDLPAQPISSDFKLER